MEKYWPKGNNWIKARTVLIVLGALAFAYYVWPGRYIYMSRGNGVVRIDRFTGWVKRY